jgi:hypothetical protein
MKKKQRFPERQRLGDKLKKGHICLRYVPFFGIYKACFVNTLQYERQKGMEGYENITGIVSGNFKKRAGEWKGIVGAVR